MTQNGDAGTIGIGGSSSPALEPMDQSHDSQVYEQCYTRIVNDYCGSGRPATQVIKVREHGSSHIKIDLFVNGKFAGTWIKTTPHFASIIRWGSWMHVKAGVALARVDIPRDMRTVLADALEKAVPEWIESMKVKKKE